MLQVKLQLAIILRLLLITDCNNALNNKPPYKKVNLPPSLTIPYPVLMISTSEEGSRGPLLPYSSWELSILSGILIDISLSRCRNNEIIPRQAQDLRYYVDRVVEKAPPHSAVSKSFMKMWNDLEECYKSSMESSNGGRAIKHIGESPSLIDPNSTTIFSLPKNHSRLKTKVKPAVLPTVGHLLLRSSWIMPPTEEIHDTDDTAESVTEKQFYSKSRSSYNKEVYERGHEGFDEYGWLFPQISAFSKRTRQKTKKSEHYLRRAFLRNRGNHYHAVFKSMTQVVKRSCPIQAERHGAMMRSVLKDIFYYLKLDTERRADKGGDERDQFSLNSNLQTKLRRCSERGGGR